MLLWHWWIKFTHTCRNLCTSIVIWGSTSTLSLRVSKMFMGLQLENLLQQCQWMDGVLFAASHDGPKEIGIPQALDNAKVWWLGWGLNGVWQLSQHKGYEPEPSYVCTWHLFLTLSSPGITWCIFGLVGKPQRRSRQLQWTLSDPFNDMDLTGVKAGPDLSHFHTMIAVECAHTSSETQKTKFRRSYVQNVSSAQTLWTSCPRSCGMW